MLKEENKIWMFLLEDEEIVEIHCESAEDGAAGQHVIGNIYVGK